MWSVNLQKPYVVEPDAPGYMNHLFLSGISALVMVMQKVTFSLSI